MAEDGFDVSPAAAERLLELHRAYLEAPPPDRAPEDAAEEVVGVPDAPEDEEIGPG
jgi:hypothetical protein